MARNTNESELKKPTIIQNQEPTIAPKSVILPKRYMQPTNEAAKIMQDSIITDKDGRNMFLDTAKIFNALSLDDEKAIEYLGGYDPNDYFKGGKIHKSFVNFFGRRIEEDTQEFHIMASVMHPYQGCILFKQDRQNLYTILVPKMFSEHELNFDGEFSPDGVYYDTRVINFSGFGGVPAAFEPDFFQKKIEAIRQSVQASVNKRG